MRGIRIDNVGFFIAIWLTQYYITDYNAALRLNPKRPDSLYGRGLAKLKGRDTKGGNADLAAARRIRPDIAGEFARYGLR